jgi:energy-coupling factor transporter ATP-binding protein EcfA2
VDADILLVDEVLAVGDIPFQRKCLQRLHQFRQQGRTIVFVSHNLHAVRSVGTRALYLYGGQVRACDDVESVVSRYVNDATGDAQHEAGRTNLRRAPIPGRTEPRIVAVALLDRSGQDARAVRVGDSLRVRIWYEAPIPIRRPNFGISIWTDEGLRVATVDTKFTGGGPEVIAGAGSIVCDLPALPLLPRTYLVKGGVYDGETGWPYDRWGWDDGSLLLLHVETSPEHTPHVVLTAEHGLLRLAASWCWDEGVAPPTASR